MTARIAPLDPPFEEEVEAQLRSMMPEGMEPIALFRTFARTLPMARAMHTWGTYELGRGLSVGLRDREIVIDRTCAQCGCEYEWGVHVAYFAERAELGEAQVASLTHGGPEDDCWETERDRLLIRLVDALHADASLNDSLWTALSAEFTGTQLLDLTMLCGWYHAISFTARASLIPGEPWAPSFADVRPR